MSIDCPICNEPILTDKAKYNCINCNVVYHYSCLKTWINIKNTCPICRNNTVHGSLLTNNVSEPIVYDIASEIHVSIPLDFDENASWSSIDSMWSLSSTSSMNSSSPPSPSPHLSSPSVLPSLSPSSSFTSIDLNEIEEYFRNQPDFDWDTSDDDISHTNVFEDRYIIRLS